MPRDSSLSDAIHALCLLHANSCCLLTTKEKKKEKERVKNRMFPHFLHKDGIRRNSTRNRLVGEDFILWIYKLNVLQSIINIINTKGLSRSPLQTVSRKKSLKIDPVRGFTPRRERNRALNALISRHGYDLRGSGLSAGREHTPLGPRSPFLFSSSLSLFVPEFSWNAVFWW